MERNLPKQCRTQVGYNVSQNLDHLTMIHGIGKGGNEYNIEATKSLHPNYRNLNEAMIGNGEKNGR